MKLIKITFRTPQKMVQDGLEAEGMFIICDKIKFITAGFVGVFSGKDVNSFLINDVNSIELE